MKLGYWQKITEQLASTTPFVAYDRAGVGKSDDNHRVPQWINNWNQVIRNSKAGGWLIHCVNAGHMVHWDEPEVVLHNIEALVEAVRP